MGLNIIINTKNAKNCSEPDLSFLLIFSKGAKSRKDILNKLQFGSKSCNQIATDLDLNWRTAYRHLKILEKENLVKSFDFGERKFYKITVKGEKAAKVPQNSR
jgi:predicted transcriptional regulator